MEAEKVHQEKVARTIQQKQDGGGVLQFVDNRMVNTLLQRVGLEDEEGFQMKTAQLQSDEEHPAGRYQSADRGRCGTRYHPQPRQLHDDAQSQRLPRLICKE